MMKILGFVFILLLSVCDAKEIKANVTGVSITGTEGAYRFAVTLKSDETGCAQYADWWEVLSEKGELLYRRILVHSHPDTQPFTRSGGSVTLKPNDVVYVRAHMNKEGYVGVVMKGSVNTGFKAVTDLPTFPKNIETQKPLPNGCLY
jgi:hypothetical protein